MTTAVLEALDARVAQLWRPPPRLSLATWADAKFVLPAGDANAGRWHTLPYQRGILDAISDPAIERVTWMKSARVGYTKCFCAAIGYYIEHDPCPILIVQPTLDDAKKHSKEDIAPMLRDVPELRARVAPPKSRDSDNTIAREALRRRLALAHRRQQPARFPAHLEARGGLRRGRRLSGERGDGRGPGRARASGARSTTQPEDHRGLDADGVGAQPHRAALRAGRPAPVLRAVSLVRRLPGPADAEPELAGEQAAGRVLRLHGQRLHHRAPLEARHGRGRRVARGGAGALHAAQPPRLVSHLGGLLLQPERDVGPARGRVPEGHARRARHAEDVRQHRARRDVPRAR